MIRDLTAFPGYGVSADGRVWRTVRTSNRHVLIPQELRQWPAKDGYPAVVLFRDGKRHFVVVHRLVLTAFRGPCPIGCVAAHNDGKRTNNVLNNLRWCTQKENIQDKWRHGTMRRKAA